MKFSTIIVRGAFSGPIFKIFWNIFSCAPSFCMVICGMVALTTDVYRHMRLDFQLSLMCHKLNFHEVHLVGPFFFLGKLSNLTACNLLWLIFKIWPGKAKLQWLLGIMTKKSIARCISESTYNFQIWGAFSGPDTCSLKSRFYLFSAKLASFCIILPSV